MKWLKIIFIFICLSLLRISSVVAQSIVLYPEETNTIWYNLEEWIFSNANIPFRTYDFNSYDAYGPGYDYGIGTDVSISVDGLLYNSQWLNNEYVTLPNLSFSDIDSVIINYSQLENSGSFLPLYQIEIFTRKTENSISIETGRLNQIDDPGMFGNTPNVEFISFPTNVIASFNRGRYKSFFAFTSELYSRTGQLGYDQQIQPALYNRTEVPVDESSFEAQRNHQQNFIWSQSLESEDYNVKLLTSAYQSNQFYEWHRIAGIEAPYTLKQYQFSANLKALTNPFYKGSKISTSVSSSDTLDYKSPAALDLSEVTISHTSEFSIPVKSVPVKVSLMNRYYHIKDNLTSSEYEHHSYSIALNAEMQKGKHIKAVLGNDVQSLTLQSPVLNRSLLQLSTTNVNIGRGVYNYSYYNRGIGFSNLQQSASHRVNNNSDFRKAYSEAKWITNLENSTHRFNGFAFVRHYWKLPNEFIEYTPVNGSLQLNTNLSYSDSENEGVLGFQTYLTSRVSPSLKFKTMLSGSMFIYGSDLFREHYSSIPIITFSESIQYTPDKNFMLELFYKYIPERTIYEYEDLNQSEGFPPSKVRSISILNLSSGMWFINRALELKFTLRNILNNTESYDTNGMYYSMSVYVSGRVNFSFK